MDRILRDLADLWCTVYENWKAYNVAYYKTFIEPYWKFWMKDDQTETHNT